MDGAMRPECGHPMDKSDMARRCEAFMQRVNAALTAKTAWGERIHLSDHPFRCQTCTDENGPLTDALVHARAGTIDALPESVRGHLDELLDILRRAVKQAYKCRHTAPNLIHVLQRSGINDPNHRSTPTRVSRLVVAGRVRLYFCRNMVAHERGLPFLELCQANTPDYLPHCPKCVHISKQGPPPAPKKKRRVVLDPAPKNRRRLLPEGEDRWYSWH